MVLEQELLPYWDWLAGDWWRGGTQFGAGLQFLITAAVLAVCALVVGYLIALVRHGPLKAGDITYRVVTNGLSELSQDLAAARVGAGPAGRSRNRSAAAWSSRW